MLRPVCRTNRYFVPGPGVSGHAHLGHLARAIYGAGPLSLPVIAAEAFAGEEFGLPPPVAVSAGVAASATVAGSSPARADGREAIAESYRRRSAPGRASYPRSGCRCQIPSAVATY